MMSLSDVKSNRGRVRGRLVVVQVQKVVQRSRRVRFIKGRRAKWLKLTIGLVLGILLMILLVALRTLSRPQVSPGNYKVRITSPRITTGEKSFTFNQYKTTNGKQDF